jgi:hypothetical protein
MQIEIDDTLLNQNETQSPTVWPTAADSATYFISLMARSHSALRSAVSRYEPLSVKKSNVL